MRPKRSGERIRPERTGRSADAPADLKGVEDAVGRSASGLAEAFELLLRLHGMPEDLLANCLKQLMDYLLGCGEAVGTNEQEFISRAKFIHASFLSLYLRNPLPPDPEGPKFKFRGPVWRWLRCRLNVFCAKNTHLWSSWVQVKTAAEPVSSDLVFKDLQKHRSRMCLRDPLWEDCDESEDPPQSEILFDEVSTCLLPVLHAIRKATYLGLWRYFRKPECRHKVSDSASFESTRADGGACEFVRTIISDYDSSYRDYEPGEAHRICRNGLRPGMSFAGFTSRPSISLERGELVWKACEPIVYNPEELDLLDEAVDDTIYSFVRERPLRATIAVVKEPLKTRTVSKGEALPYYIAKPVQKILHTHMRHMPCFELIGRPNCATDLVNPSVWAGFSDSPEYINDIQWHSGDYESATDCLSARLSRFILETLLDDVALVNPELYRLCLSVLAPHYIEYPDMKIRNAENKFQTVRLPPVLQTNGQLMGSILSFPVLCLANLGVYLCVRQRALLRDSPVHRRPTGPYSLNYGFLMRSVLINGDDILYKGSSAEWDDHVAIGAGIGLKMSMGKAYRHPIYANINKTSYHCRPGGTPVRISYLNCGLFFGKHKVQGKVFDEDPETSVDVFPHIAVLNEVLRGSPPGKSADVFKMYASLWSREIKSEARGRNLFICQALGGFGVQRPDGIATTFTRAQLTLAARLSLRDCLSAMEGPMCEGYGPTARDRLLVDPVQEAPVQLCIEKVPKAGTELFREDLLEFPWISWEYSERGPKPADDEPWGPLM